MHVKHIDHVAIRVQDPELSAAWYQEVLSLQRILQDRIGSVPVILEAGKTMINLFPAPNNVYPFYDDNKNTVMHIAFNVDHENFDEARVKLQSMGIEYEVVDRGICLSLYFNDPDHNRLELTYWRVNLNNKGEWGFV